jgi:nucleoside-triphosphatase THEP1
MEWCTRQKNIGGFVCPDVDFRRKLFDIQKRCFREFQVTESDERPAVMIGHYQFLLEGFQLAHGLLEEMALQCKEADPSHFWLVDEIGKLELRKQGFEPAFSNFLSAYNHAGKGTLILVIRDYLLEEAIQHYHLTQAKIIHHDWFE